MMCWLRRCCSTGTRRSALCRRVPRHPLRASPCPVCGGLSLLACKPLATVSHFRLSVDLDLERLLAFRQEINREVPGVKISVNDLLVKACARRWWPCLTSISSLMKRHKVSAALRMPTFRWPLRCLPGYTPIVRSANRKSISDISNEIHSLVTRASGHAEAGRVRAGPLACQIWGCSASGSLTPSSIHRKAQSSPLAPARSGGSTRRANRRAPANDGIAILRSPGHRWRGRCGFSPGTQATIETPTLMFIRRRAMHDKYDVLIIGGSGDTLPPSVPAS